MQYRSIRFFASKQFCEVNFQLVPKTAKLLSVIFDHINNAEYVNENCLAVAEEKVMIFDNLSADVGKDRIISIRQVTAKNIGSSWYL